MSFSVMETPATIPSRMAVNARPCDSPAVRYRTRSLIYANLGGVLDGDFHHSERSVRLPVKSSKDRAPWETSIPSPSRFFSPRRLAILEERGFAVDEIKDKEFPVQAVRIDAQPV